MKKTTGDKPRDRAGKFIKVIATNPTQNKTMAKTPVDLGDLKEIGIPAAAALLGNRVSVKVTDFAIRQLGNMPPGAQRIARAGFPALLALFLWGGSLAGGKKGMGGTLKMAGLGAMIHSLEELLATVLPAGLPLLSGDRDTVAEAEAEAVEVRTFQPGMLSGADDRLALPALPAPGASQVFDDAQMTRVRAVS